MKKTNLNKKQNWKFFVRMFTLAALALFVSCEKNEEPFSEQNIVEKAITGEYTKLNSTIVNSDNGIPQGFGTLRAFIGNELELLDNGSFESSTLEGTWIKEGNMILLYPVDGLTINLEFQKIDEQTLGLLQKYDSYDDYADGIIAYTFIKKGSDIGLGQDLLSSIEIWF